MEHRWGQRFTIDLAVKIVGWTRAVRPALLIDLSVSGAAIRVSTDMRPLTCLQVAFALPSQFPHRSPVVSAYVTRQFGDCIGIEWSELAPDPVRAILRVAAMERAIRALRPAPAALRGSQARPAANHDDIVLA
jgi:PilZ domain-containing protein